MMYTFSIIGIFVTVVTVVFLISAFAIWCLEQNWFAKKPPKDEVPWDQSEEVIKLKEDIFKKVEVLNIQKTSRHTYSLDLKFKKSEEIIPAKFTYLDNSEYRLSFPYKEMFTHDEIYWISRHIRDYIYEQENIKLEKERIRDELEAVQLRKKHLGD